MTQEEIKAALEGQTIQRVGTSPYDGNSSLEWIHLANGMVFELYGGDNFEVTLIESDVESIGGPVDE